MPPTGGQGSAQAIEDALVLAECIGGEADLPTAIAAFEARRMPRVYKFMQTGWRQGDMATWRNPVVAAGRNTVMRLGAPFVWRDQQRVIGAEP
jgi:salicylate hydroxylase